MRTGFPRHLVGFNPDGTLDPNAPSLAPTIPEDFLTHSSPEASAAAAIWLGLRPADPQAQPEVTTGSALAWLDDTSDSAIADVDTTSPAAEEAVGADTPVPAPEAASVPDVQPEAEDDSADSSSWLAGFNLAPEDDTPVPEAASVPDVQPEAEATPGSDSDSSSMSWLAGFNLAPEDEATSSEEPETAVEATVIDPHSEVHVHHHYESAAESRPAAASAVVDERSPAAEQKHVERLSEAAVREPRPDPGPIAPAEKVKEPLFVWRGKPIGGARTAAAAAVAVEYEPELDTGPAEAEIATSVSYIESPEDGSAGIDAQTWFESTMQSALDLGVSDLHIGYEQDENGTVLTARVRIDGQMQVLETVHGMDARTIIGKFKAKADLASAGSFVPEESIYKIEVEGEVRKARIALFRTANGGDALVLRLPPTGALRSLEELEFAPRNLTLFHDLLANANRMILIAGPMGSGKTTTAHAALMHVATPNRTVWSVEDPVERDLPGLTQLEVDEKNGAGFPALLPVLVRSDYDTLFLGEIRDKATAGAGVRQAKAGRQVITTIHANDNVTALLRLIELSQDGPLSVMDAVLGVVSQRLVRKLNPEWDGVDEATRYRGRVPVHEVLRVTDELTEAVMRDKPIAEIKKIASDTSESTFKMDAERLVTAGITDWDEIHRVLGQSA